MNTHFQLYRAKTQNLNTLLKYPPEELLMVSLNSFAITTLSWLCSCFKGMHYNELAPRCHWHYVNGDLGAYSEIESLSSLQAHYLISLGMTVFPDAAMLQFAVAVDVN